ncbi:MAG: CDP-alcohol phosphatidyltransferase family protein [Bacteroidota bacterium]
MKKHLPNALTLTNAFAGSAALVFIFQENWLNVFICVSIGLLADLLDGAVARLLGVSSELGKQLDSLADMVSFGVVPGAIMYQMLRSACEASPLSSTWAFVAFLIPVFACLRLARFNLDTRQSEHFIGLPTPAATFLVLGLLLIEWQELYGANLLTNPFLLLFLVSTIAYLMNSPILLFSFKFKHLTWRGNEVRFTFLGLVIVLILVLQWASLVPILIAYLLLSVLAKGKF